MDMPQDHDDQLLAMGGVPALLVRNKPAIFAEFKQRLRERLSAAAEEPGPIIINTLPAFITRLALALAPHSELSFASEYSNIALAHGNERARMTNYSLAEVIREYQVLRELLVDLLREQAMPAPAPEQWRVVHRSIDEAVAEAASAFVQVQQGYRDQFTAALSHDVRGPLSNAMNYVDLIRRNAEPAQHGHFAARALYNLKRIDGMIRELLDATRANAGARLMLRIEPAEATALASEVIGDLTLRAGDRFVLDAVKPVHGWWDADRIKQALLSLLENALKYGRDDTPITCRIGEVEGRLFLSVHNQGEPIPPEVIPVLFQPFRRSLVAEKSHKSGWGLGLVMVQSIAEAHGGSVGVESTAESGTTFTLDLLRDARQKAA